MKKVSDEFLKLDYKQKQEFERDLRARRQEQEDILKDHTS